MNVILFDDHRYAHLKPFTFTRPMSELRIGILTIKEKWERYLQQTVSHCTQPHLSKKYSLRLDERVNYLINGSILPTPELVQRILELPLHSELVQGDTLIALKVDGELVQRFAQGQPVPASLFRNETDLSFIKINNLWDLFRLNDKALKADFQLITQGRESQPLSATNQVLGNRANIFLEEGAWVECSILNVQDAPIYVGKDAQIMEGSMLRNGVALCEGAATKMGAKIYGATTIGPHSKIGGEVNNSVILGYSNKGHDGFLGNSVLGEWCNLGADTNNSNLKNTYANVELWNYATQKFEDTGLQFCGLMMGDHSKCGINSMFNTGTVVGVGVNFFGEGFPRKFIPSFAWGSTKGFSTYKMDKMLETARAVMERRHIELSAIEIELLQAVFDQTQTERVWDK